MFTTSDIEKYFNAEKQESLLFIVIGLAGIMVAVISFFVYKTNFYKGAAIPLLLIGLLLSIVGFTVYKRCDSDRIRNVYAYSMNPMELKNKELPRMQVVMKNFVIYRYTEIILALVGIGLFVYFKSNSGAAFWKGLGLSLAIMSLIALTADYFAAYRGKIYINGIESFTQKK